jgi:N-acyl-D-amino-acid deacylase
MSGEFDLVVRGGSVVDGTGTPPRTADVGVRDGLIVEVGAVEGRGREVIDADGAVVTPGWVDIHTHYDGQVTWDPDVTPSSWHGVTTIVMGNCGVGFAPVRPGGEEFLIELMEGVEDIPGTALHEGIDWSWESFAGYLDALDATPRVLDVAAQVPHAPLRAYVMGERAHEQPDAEEIDAMARLAEDAVRAGAVGVTTSRTILHSSKHGLVPGTHATPDEVVAFGDALGRVGHGVLQLVSDNVGTEEEVAWMADVARRTGRTVTFSLAQAGHDPDLWRSVLTSVDALTADGLPIVPQVSCRPTGMLFGLQSSLHPFAAHPTYRAMTELPLAERVARLRTPEVRRALLAEEPQTKNLVARVLMTRWDQMFPLGDPPDYEPPASSSIAAVASVTGQAEPELALDWLLERDGQALLFAPLTSYADHDHEVIRSMMTHPGTVLGLGDGGAHCGLICDASFTTYLLTHWVRDRTRGERLPIEEVVKMQTSRPAEVYGFADRGSLVPGKRADLNVIDLDGLRLHAPEMVNDLPADGRRLVQRVDGYEATVCAGEVTMRDGAPTGARPGRLVRGQA